MMHRARKRRSGGSGSVGVRRWAGILPLLGLVGVLFPTAPVRAQEPPAILGGAAAESDAIAPEPTSADEIAARRTLATEELAAAETEFATASPDRADHLDEVRERLRRLESLLAQQASLGVEESVPIDVPTAGVPDRVPSPFALNALYEERAAFEREIGRRIDELALSRESLAKAKEKLEAAERSRRKARSEVEQSDPGGRPSAERSLQLRQLENRIAQEEVHLRTLETRALHRARESAPDASEIDERIRLLRQRLANGEGDASEGLAALTRREGELRHRREAAERRLGTVELRLGAAQNRFAEATEPSADLLEAVEALTARRDAVRQEISLSDAQLERLGSQRSLWKQWDALLRGKSAREELDVWEVAARDRIDALKQEEIRGNGRVSDLQIRLATTERRLAGLSVDSPLRRAIEEKRDSLDRLHQEQLADVSTLAAEQRSTQQFLNDLQQGTWGVDPLGFIVRSAQSAGDIWAHEITTVDDASITVRSVVLALLLFGVGMWASRRGSVLAGRVFEQKFKLDAGAAHALQTLSFYVLIVVFALLALRAVHFPLTAFTVLGGALAIGIGFGSQNVMNNFISGLILMLERPVRARDVVEVDGNHGTIEHIGARSTQIRSTDGRHIIVPNSFFLENNVVNWTLSDDLIRARVTVGVRYGSPTRLVEQLIQRVVAEEPRVLKDPEPIVVFERFGDNSLDFDVYFWVTARSPMQVRSVQSEIRFRIDDVFREHDLVIAFPQRDVHLDSVSPIEVRVLDGAVPLAPDRRPDRDEK